MVISGIQHKSIFPNRKSGLIDAMERQPFSAAKISLGGSDIVRHPLVRRVDAYEEYYILQSSSKNEIKSLHDEYRPVVISPPHSSSLLNGRSAEFLGEAP